MTNRSWCSRESASARLVVTLSILAYGRGCSGDHGDDDPTSPSTSSTRSALSYPANAVVPLEGIVGTLPGAGSVGADGSYQYDLPLAVPPGRLGMAPKLSLSYSSRRGNGLLGVGWGISGLSAIKPCAKTIAIDGVAGTVKYDGTDPLCWDGHRLLPSSDGARLFRRDDDNGIRITNNGDAIIAQLRDGTQLVFSSIPDGNQLLYDHVLVQQSDLHGNHIDYTYTVMAPGEYYPAVISYTSRDDESASRFVQFYYGDARPDPIINYGNGRTFAIRQRLTQIVVVAPNPTTISTVWTYSLVYNTSSATKRSVLTKVVRNGALGGAQQARDFLWTSTAFIDYDLGAPNTIPTALDVGAFGPAGRFLALDLDNDGKDELLYGRDQNALVSLLSSPSGSPLLGTQRTLAGALSLYDAVTGDIDGDGIVDLIAPVFGDGNDVTTSRYALLQWQGSLATGAFAATADYGPYYVNEDNNLGRAGNVNLIHLADLDGDGLVDMIHGTHAHGDFNASALETYYPAFFNYSWTYARNTSGTTHTPSFGSAVNLPWINDHYFQSPLTGGLHATYTLGHGGARQTLYFANEWDGLYSLTHIPCLKKAFAGFQLDDSDHLVEVNDSQTVPMSAYADVNGDGETDFAQYDVVGRTICITWGGAPTGTPRTCVAIPTSATDFATVTPSACTDDQKVGPWQLRVYDMDADGRDDIALVRTDRREGYRVWFDGANQLDVHSLANQPIAVGDFDGDGVLDALVGDVNTSGPASVARAPHVTEDVITGVADDSPGALPVGREQVFYTNQWWPDVSTWPGTSGATELWAPKRYGGGAAPATPSCTYPQHCMHTGMEVVQRHVVVQGEANGQVLDENYSYGDPRVDYQGRGFLGFGIVDRWEPEAMREQVTKYERVGNLGHVLPEEQWTMVPIIKETLPPPCTGAVCLPSWPTYPHASTSPARVVRVKYDYDGCGGTSAPLAEPNCVHQTQTDEWEQMLSFGTAQTGTVAPALYGSVGPPSPSDVGATPLRTAFATYVHDAFGNITSETAWTQGGTQTATTTSFWPMDPALWIPSRPHTVTVAVGCADAGCTSASDGTLNPTPRRTDFDFTDGDLTAYTVEPTSTDPGIQATTQFVHNYYGEITNITRSAPGQPDRTEGFIYDAAEHIFVVAHFDALNHERQYLYHPAFGSLVAESDENNVITSYQLDELGHLRSVLPTGASWVKYSYTPRIAGGKTSGVIEKITTQDGRSRTIETDGWGHQLTDTHVGFDGSAIARGFTYDLQNRLIGESRPGWGTPGTAGSSTLFDSLGRPAGHMDAAGGSTSYVQSFAATYVTDPGSHLHAIQRDVDGRVVASQQWAPDGTMLTTSYKYGDFGQLHRVVDSQGHVITTSYDQRGRTVSVTTPDSGTSGSSYDAFGNITGTTRGGSSATIARDLLGRPTTVTNADGTATFTYDSGSNAVGKLVESVSGDGTVEVFTFDSAGRHTNDLVAAGGQSAIVKRSYDAMGRLATFVYPSIPGTSVGLSVGYTYNSHGYLASVARNDSGATTPVFWKQTSGTLDDLPGNVVYGNGITGSRTYDAAGRLTEIKDGTVVDLVYAYDAESNISSLADHVGARTDRYYYDSLHRLNEWQAVPASTTRTMFYAYDALGNLTSEKLGSSVIATYGYGAAAGPHAVTSGPQGAIHYDARGRQISTSSRTITYTEADLPKSVITNGVATSFGYDASGARVYRQNSTGWTLSLDGVFERRSDAGSVVDWYYINTPEGVVAQTSVNEATQARSTGYYHRDHHGTPVASSGPSGALTRRLYYDPWGHRTDQNAVPVTTADTGALLVGLDGLRYEDDLGLVDQRGRFYDPSLRHFLSPDPLVSRPVDSQSYNRYSYIANDPVNRTDPSGFEDLSIFDDPSYGTSLVSWGGSGPMTIPGSAPGGIISGGGPAHMYGEPPPPPPVYVKQTPSGSPAPTVAAQHVGSGNKATERSGKTVETRYSYNCRSGTCEYAWRDTSGVPTPRVPLSDPVHTNGATGPLPAGWPKPWPAAYAPDVTSPRGATADDKRVAALINQKLGEWDHNATMVQWDIVTDRNASQGATDDPIKAAADHYLQEYLFIRDEDCAYVASTFVGLSDLRVMGYDALKIVHFDLATTRLKPSPPSAFVIKWSMRGSRDAYNEVRANDPDDWP